jgi:hypothetical protein
MLGRPALDLDLAPPLEENIGSREAADFFDRLP